MEMEGLAYLAMLAAGGTGLMTLFALLHRPRTVKFDSE